MITRENGQDLKERTFANGVFHDSGGKTLPVFRSNKDSAFILEVAIESLASDSTFIKTLVDNIPNPIFITQLDSSIKYVNPALERLTGYNSSELTGSKVPYPWWPQDMIERYQKEAGPGQNMDLNQVERSFHKKNGELFCVNVKIQALKQGEAVQYWLGIWEDVTQRKLAGKKLEEAVEEFENIFHSVSDMVSIQDKDCRLLKVNQAYAKIFKRTPEELIGRYCYSQMHGSNCPISSCPHQQTLQTGKPAVSNCYEPKLGLYLEVSTSPIFDSKGEILGTVHIAKDISERKAMETRLSKAQEFNTQILTHAPNPVMVISGSNSIQYVNPAFELLTGFSEKEVLGLKPPFPYWPKEKIGEYQLDYSKENITYSERQFAKKNGEAFWVRLASVPVQENGSVKYFLVNWADITELKQINNTLAESESKFQSMAQQSPNMIFINKGGRVVFANQKCEDLTGYTKEEICSFDFNFLKLIALNQRDLISQRHQRHLGGLDVEPFELQMITKDGEHISGLFGSKVIIYEGGPAILGTIVDISEQKRVENELHQQRDRAQTYLDIAGVMIIALDSTGKVTLINKKGCEILGFRSEEVLGADWFDQFLPERNRASIKWVFNQSIAGQAEFAAYNENPVLTKGGEERLIAWHNTILKDRAGNITGFLSSGEDITDRRQAETALQASEEKLRLMFKSVTEGVTVIDLNGTITEVNARTLEIHGFKSKDELVGKSVFGLIAPSDHQRTERDMRKVLQQGSVRDIECTFLKKDGSKVPGELSASVMNDASGKPAGFVAITRDITERKLMHENMRKSEEKYSNIVENGNDGIIILQDGIIKFANSMVEKITGFSHGDAVGKTLIEFVAPRFRELIIERYQRRMSGEKVPTKYEISILTKDGKEIPVEVNANQIDFEGRLADIAVIRDITERRESEDKIHLGQEDLKNSYRNLQNALEGSIDMAARMVEMRDPYTAGHQRRVAKLATAIASELGLPEDMVSYLGLAAKVHDIGKINVPAEILTKTGKLTKLEFQMIMTHAQGGYDILKGVDFPWPLAEIILQHHERLDGSGYPKGLKGDEILLEARIIAVADTVEAMSAHRPYRPSLGMNEALMQIKAKKGQLYDNRVVEACSDIIENKEFRFEDGDKKT